MTLKYLLLSLLRLENDMGVSVDDYTCEEKCIYREEKYSVRNNGAVLKHSREEKRLRPTDNQWTFGKLNGKTGYMEIASVRVHRIVASAFHGVHYGK